VITTGGVLTGSTIAARGMSTEHNKYELLKYTVTQQQTRQLYTYRSWVYFPPLLELIDLVIAFRFMNGLNDDVELPFSVLDQS